MDAVYVANRDGRDQHREASPVVGQVDSDFRWWHLSKIGLPEDGVVNVPNESHMTQRTESFPNYQKMEGLRKQEGIQKRLKKILLALKGHQVLF